MKNDKTDMINLQNFDTSVNYIRNIYYQYQILDLQGRKYMRMLRYKLDMMDDMAYITQMCHHHNSQYSIDIILYYCQHYSNNTDNYYHHKVHNYQQQLHKSDNYKHMTYTKAINIHQHMHNAQKMLNILSQLYMMYNLYY